MHINITKDDFDLTREMNRFNHNKYNYGAISIFIGKVRPENGLKKMQIDCYPEMAQKEIKNVAEIARSRWTLDKIRIIHRYGLLKPNDNIVLLIIGSRHRADCMSANEFIMDFLKSLAPFWKKEIYSDKEIWIEQNESDLKKLQQWESI
tara:strand:+ start:553 stop:999 length:447 start_codon:yes stop_codon:yes gene_type:complete